MLVVMTDVTQILSQIQQGDSSAAEQLLPSQGTPKLCANQEPVTDQLLARKSGFESTTMLTLKSVIVLLTPTKVHNESYSTAASQTSAFVATPALVDFGRTLFLRSPEATWEGDRVATL